MAQLNDITSTEKLLDFIRNKSSVPLPEGESFANAPLPVAPPRRKIAEIIPFRKVSFLKAAVVGIYIGREYLWLAKTVKGPDGVPVLVDKRQREIPPAINRNSAEFVKILKWELESFCDEGQKQSIWAIMSAAGVEVRHIRIPRVPKKQTASAVLWSAKKEAPFDEKDNIFDFEVLGEVIEQGIAKLAVMYYRASKRVVEEMRRSFSQAGFPLTGLSIAPFAIQNIFRTGWLAGDGGPIASLFIGNDYSRINIYINGTLAMTRDIKAGINSMLESLIEGLHGKAQTAEAGAGGPPIDMDQARKILFSLSPDSPPLEEQDAAYGLEEEEIWQLILPAFDRLVRQVERTLEYFNVSLGNEKVEKIHVSQAMNVYRRFAEYMGGQLNLESDLFDPLLRPYSFRDDNQLVYACDSERIALAPALGIALSDSIHTPNFLFTYKDKERASAVRQINAAIFMVFLLSVFLCSGIFTYQLHAMSEKRKTIRQLERQMPPAEGPVDRGLIMATLSTVKQDMASAKIYSQRYQGLAIISELSHLTPRDIRLINAKVNLGQHALDKPASTAPAKANPAAKAPEEQEKELAIEGFASGEKKALPNILADYVMKLDGSPLFQQIKVQKTNEEQFKKTSLLRFVITMKLEGL